MHFVLLDDGGVDLDVLVDDAGELQLDLLVDHQKLLVFLDFFG